jgi:triosephosphate isomerase (TIM)
MRKKLIAGNWKMNGTLSDVALIEKIADSVNLYKDTIESVICVPAVFIKSFFDKNIMDIGGQNCHHLKTGAYTGEVSADMLQQVGAKYVIVGHSERRIDCHETDAMIKAKANAAFEAGLKPIICVGETKEHYYQGICQEIIIEQLKHSVPETTKPFAIGYEPIWAIGTGLIPQLNEIFEIHSVIRETLKTLIGQDTANKVQILYGGSVKPNNASDIAKLDNVDGALVGGASLNVNDFTAIINAFA